MLLNQYSGKRYSYSYEPDTGNYLLYKNNGMSHKILQGKDASLFRKQIEYLSTLPSAQCKDSKLTEHIISIFF